MSLPIGNQSKREISIGVIPVNIKRSLSSNLLDKGPMEPKKKAERTPPEARMMPK